MDLEAVIMVEGKGPRC